MSLRLRPYQREAVEAVLRAFETEDSTLLLLATGLGKTICAMEIMRRTRGRCLFLAHTDELVSQPVKKIEEAWGERVDVEKAESRDSKHSSICVGSVQTMCRANRLARFRPDEFAVVIVDEVHHASADSYVRILEHFTGAKRLGLTATATRMDGKKLGEHFERVACEYNLIDAIRDGWLVPIRRKLVRVSSLVLDDVHVRGGDFVAHELGEAVLRDEATVQEWAVAIRDLAADRKTLAFCPPRPKRKEGEEKPEAPAARLAEVLNRPGYGGASVYLDGETPKNERQLALGQFARGDVHRIANCALFLEGFDEPSIAALGLARPTKSHSLYAQMLGRGTRALAGVLDGLEEATPAERRAAIAASAKPDLLVLDFTDASGTFDLVTAVDILGAADDDRVKREAERIERENPDADVLDALTVARARIEAQDRAAAAKMQSFLDAQKRAGVVARGVVHAFDVDADAILGVDRVRASQRGARFGSPALSEKQWDWLARNGFTRPSNPTAEDYALGRSRLDALGRRIKEGLPTLKETKILQEKGLPVAVPRIVARKMIDKLAELGGGKPWKARLSVDEVARWTRHAMAQSALIRAEGSGE